MVQGRMVEDEPLPDDVQEALRKADRLERITLGVVLGTVLIVFSVMGNSQAMKTAWVEDMLSFVPPIAFLVGVRATRRPATVDRPYGFHASIGMSHLVAAVSLVAMGGYLIVDATMKLVTAEHASIGGVNIFGTTIWLGWLMMAAMVVTGIPPMVLGQMKLKLAPKLHNKVLYADADMNKADWMTSLSALAGVAGIGIGWWWADAAAALVISVSILRDGIGNLKAAVAELLDARPTTIDDKHPHPLLSDIDNYLRRLDWATTGAARVRDEGQVFHVEGFVVPRTPEAATPERLEIARQELLAMDWKIRDVVLCPVPELPAVLRPELLA